MYPIAQWINAALDNNPAARVMTGCEHLPRTNIMEGAEDYRILMDLPGVRNEDLEISLENDILTVKAQRSLETPDGYTNRRLEMPGKVEWSRTFDVGGGVDTEKISAKLDQGVLMLSLPKSEKNLPRRIQVQ
jgi:HSP20 family protein